MRLIFFIALRQLWDRKLLNSIAVGGVALGVLVLIAMNGVMQGFQMKFKGEILKVSPHITLFDKELAQGESILHRLLGKHTIEQVWHQQPSDRATRIRQPRDLVRALVQLPQIESACASLVGQAILSAGATDLGIDMRGVTPLEQDRCTPMQRYITEGSWRALAITADGIALGSGVAEKLGAHLGDQLRIVAPGGQPQSLKVVAIYEAGVPPIDRTRVYVNLTTAQGVLRRANVIGRIEVRLFDPFEARSIAARLEKITGYDAESWQEANANFLSLFDMQNMIVNMVVAAILVVGGFGILAIQIMIVLQKTRDIAILRSVGLRRFDILWIFLIQGIIVATIGATLGDVLGWRLVEFLGTLKIKSEGLVKSSTFLVYKDPMIYVYGAVFALCTGVVASLLPAWRASRVEPVDVLRGQIG